MGEVLRSKIGGAHLFFHALDAVAEGRLRNIQLFGCCRKAARLPNAGGGHAEPALGPQSAQLHFTEQYRNMKEKLAEHPQLVELARSACLAAGITPRMAALTALALLSAGCPAPIWGLAAGDTTARMSISPCRLWKSKRHSARADFSVWPDRFDLTGFSL